MFIQNQREGLNYAMKSKFGTFIFNGVTESRKKKLKRGDERKNMECFRRNPRLRKFQR